MQYIRIERVILDLEPQVSRDATHVTVNKTAYRLNIPFLEVDRCYLGHSRRNVK